MSTVPRTAKYFTYDVPLPSGEVVQVRTNLSEKDLDLYFPQPGARRSWFLMLAKQSTLPKQYIRR